MPRTFSPWWAELFEKCFISLCLITLRKLIQKIMPFTLLSNRQFQVKSNSETSGWYSHTGSPAFSPTLQFLMVAVRKRKTFVQGTGNVAEKCFSEVLENWYGWHLNIHFCVWGFFMVFILTPAIFGSMFYLIPHQWKEHTITDLPYGILLFQKKNLWEVGKICPKTKHATQGFY